MHVLTGSRTTTGSPPSNDLVGAECTECMPRDQVTSLMALQQRIEGTVFGIVETEDEDLLEEFGLVMKEGRTGLKPNEMLGLIVAYTQSKAGEFVGYAEIADFCFEHLGRPLSDGTIFNSLKMLRQFGFIEPAGNTPSGKAGRQRDLYQITSSGIIALYFAMGLTRQMGAGRRPIAA